MESKPIFAALLSTTFFIAGLSASALASSCLNGSCHQDLTKLKHLHGPTGAEMAGVQGCIMCHTPAGPTCSSTQAGKFQIKEEGICLTCHSKGSGSQHSSSTPNCLECHNPHGSNTSPYMLREKS